MSFGHVYNLLTEPTELTNRLDEDLTSETDRIANRSVDASCIQFFSTSAMLRRPIQRRMTTYAIRHCVLRVGPRHHRDGEASDTCTCALIICYTAEHCWQSPMLLQLLMHGGRRLRAAAYTLTHSHSSSHIWSSHLPVQTTCSTPVTAPARWLQPLGTSCVFMRRCVRRNLRRTQCDCVGTCRPVS